MLIFFQISIVFCPVFRKKLLSITFLTIVLVAAVLLNLSCKETPQDNGGTSPSNSVVANVCSGTPSEKQRKIRAKIKENIEGDDKLNYQHESCQSGCRKEKFFFEPVMETNGDATLYIWGSIFINDKTSDLDNLHKKYKDYFKKGCVAKVVFTSPPTPSPTPGVTTTVLQNFEYTTLCEYPNGVCSDGTCMEGCKK